MTKVASLPAATVPHEVLMELANARAAVRDAISCAKRALAVCPPTSDVHSQILEALDWLGEDGSGAMDYLTVDDRSFWANVMAS